MAIAKTKSKTHRYVEELQEIVRAKFPAAKFRVGPMPDTAKGVALWTFADAEFWEVSDLVRGRELELMVEEGVFIYVIPMPLEELRQ